jgi:hypothetical protein
VDEHPPIPFFSPPPPPEAQERLLSQADVAAVFDPFLAEDTAVFDPADAFYVPLAGHGAVRAPGPRIRIYKLRLGS